MNDALRMMLSAPPTQLDPSMVERLKKLDGKEGDELRAGLHEILDHCARYSLASDFVMKVLDHEWRELGGKPDDPTPWREKMP